MCDSNVNKGLHRAFLEHLLVAFHMRRKGKRWPRRRKKKIIYSKFPGKPLPRLPLSLHLLCLHYTAAAGKCFRTFTLKIRKSVMSDSIS